MCVLLIWLSYQNQFGEIQPGQFVSSTTRTKHRAKDNAEAAELTESSPNESREDVTGSGVRVERQTPVHEARNSLGVSFEWILYI